MADIEIHTPELPSLMNDKQKKPNGRISPFGFCFILKKQELRLLVTAHHGICPTQGNASKQ